MLTLEAARERARASRPEVRSAALRTAQAANARRIALSGWIPDVSLVASYTRLVNFESLPNDAAAVGVSFNWAPWDWGRKSHERVEQAHANERAREANHESQQRSRSRWGARRRAMTPGRLLAGEAPRSGCVGGELRTDRTAIENAAILRDVLRTEANFGGTAR
jgi:hypothetical protein